jgi:hypothetical protein
VPAAAPAGTGLDDTTETDEGRANGL